jgi:undecaprenyl-diphosphatase
MPFLFPLISRADFFIVTTLNTNRKQETETMNFIQAAILGIVQGLTEILPISSSAHLILIPWAFNWPPSGITFDVALHLGTLLALCVYFRQDIVEMSHSFFRGLRGKAGHCSSERLPFYIIAGTIPAALVGKFLEEPIEDIFRASPVIIVVFLILFGLILALSDRIGTKLWKLDHIDLKSSMVIGLAQCLALMPGVSRSGITITAALFLGYNRETAARFSFLLSLPIVAGAGILKLGQLLRHGIPPGEVSILLIGIATSAIFGYLGVAFLLKFVQRHSIYPFVWYRLLAGVAALVFIAIS